MHTITTPTNTKQKNTLTTHFPSNYNNTITIKRRRKKTYILKNNKLRVVQEATDNRGNATQEL